jgi:hypothetical protein
VVYIALVEETFTCIYEAIKEEGEVLCHMKSSSARFEIESAQLLLMKPDAP